MLSPGRDTKSFGRRGEAERANKNSHGQGRRGLVAREGDGIFRMQGVIFCGYSRARADGRDPRRLARTPARVGVGRRALLKNQALQRVRERSRHARAEAYPPRGWVRAIVCASLRA